MPREVITAVEMNDIDSVIRAAERRRDESVTIVVPTRVGRELWELASRAKRHGGHVGRPVSEGEPLPVPHQPKRSPVSV